MNKAPAPKTIAVIGAGMAGITAARTLKAHGYSVTLFDKSRTISGRMSTRVSRHGFNFDHGAQYITAHGAAFRTFLEDAISRGSAGIWESSNTTQDTDKKRYIGVPAMNRLLAPFAYDLDIRFETTIEPIIRDPKGWCVHSREYGDHGVFDIIVSTLPSEQAKHLGSSIAAFSPPLAKVKVAPCWALMLAFETPLQTGFSVYKNADSNTQSPLSWIARDSHKPGRDSTFDQWVLHASPGWSAEHLELENEAIAARMLEAFRALVPVDVPAPIYTSAHRWRYAMTTQPLGKPCLHDDSRTFFMGGDWCLGARVEAAFDSGLAMANAIISP